MDSAKSALRVTNASGLLMGRPTAAHVQTLIPFAVERAVARFAGEPVPASLANLTTLSATLRAAMAALRSVRRGDQDDDAYDRLAAELAGVEADLDRLQAQLSGRQSEPVASVTLLSPTLAAARRLAAGG